jgi:hypothetical protein
LKGIRYFMRNFTATAVREHLRSQLDDTGGKPELTPKEVELVRFIRERSGELPLDPQASQRVSAVRS